MNIVCLVSRQAMPNVLPVLMYKPQKVFLLATKQEIDCGRHLQSLFQSKGIKVFLYNDIDAYNDPNLLKRLDEIFSKENDDVTLNVTGGTKMMAIPAYEYFREKKKPVFYCNTDLHEIIHLLPVRKNQKIDASINIVDYLAAYGYEIEDEKSFLNSLEFPNFWSGCFLTNWVLLYSLLTKLEGK